MINILGIFIGGGLGSLFRYAFNCALKSYATTYLIPATFLANITGCLLIGFLGVIFMNKLQLPACYKTFLITGFCGGLTTFSTFSFEIVKYFQDGFYVNAFCYIFLSISCCISGVFLGGCIAKYFI